MNSVALVSVANAAQNLLEHPRLRATARGTVPLTPPFPPIPLALRWSTRAFTALLSDEGCSQTASSSLGIVLETACENLRATTETAYSSMVAGLSTFFEGTQEEWEEWDGGVRAACERRFEDGLRRCEQVLLDEVRSARARHASLTSSSIPEESPQPGAFTEEVLEILNNAFLVRDSVSRAERRQLAGVTRLTERQILTWPEMGTEGGAGMVVDEGGLTLSMDAIEADVGGGMGMGGRFGYSF